MAKKKDLETEINEFINYFNCDCLMSFLKDTLPLFELYNIEEDDDWVEEIVGKEDKQNVRLIRTVYLMSIIAENQVPVLVGIRSKFKNLWKRMEQGNVRQ
jgi:hypothetical protein